MLAAVLVQVKTLLDNADGQLARATGQVSLSGRYLDTEADLVVNAALFLALARVTGQPWLALGSFVALTLVLAVDFNMSELYRDAHRVERHAPAALHGRVERVLERAYRILFAPQDRAIRAFSRARLERIVGGPPTEAVASAYNDRVTVTLLANLGLSTQLTALGLCLALEIPDVYLWLTIGCLALLPALQLRRERLARSALARSRAG
jgi:archaetidylinositol phosphate synthase